jgi:hypothetical protein
MAGVAHPHDYQPITRAQAPFLKCAGVRSIVVGTLVGIFLFGEGRHDLAGQQLPLAEQSSILERLEIRQVAQRIEAEVGQEGLRRYIGVGRPPAARLFVICFSRQQP